MGQFYTELAVGTAKPDWRNGPCPAHLFDIIATPSVMTVADYRKRVMQLIHEITARGRVPVIVGGSLFYIKSLFYPPCTLPILAESVVQDEEDSWDVLHGVDPDRAATIHPNDTYRIKRALAIWRSTGMLPSSCKPQLEIPFNPLIVALMPPVELLRAGIKQRAHEMIERDGWIAEAQGLDDSWRNFLQEKKIIGYQLIFDWLNGSIASQDELIEKICISTNQYAKRQLTFLKKLVQELTGTRNADGIEVSVCTYTSAQQALSELAALLEKSRVSDKLQYEK